MRRTFALIAVIFSAAPLAGAAVATRGVPYEAAKASEWIEAQQKPGGAFFQEDLASYRVAETAGGLAAVSGSAAAIESAMAYVAGKGPQAADEGGRAALLVIGLSAAEKSPRSFGGDDYVRHLDSFYNPLLGSYDDNNIYSHALAISAFAAVDVSPPERAVSYLEGAQCSRGGFSIHAACLDERKDDVDATAMAVMALVSLGRPSSDPVIQRARGFLVEAQNDAGGYGGAPGEITNANSTGLVLAALNALKEDPRRPPWKRAERTGPLDALHSLQTPSGAFKWRSSSRSPDGYATVQAMIGIADGSYPMRRLRSSDAIPENIPSAPHQAEAVPKPPPARSDAPEPDLLEPPPAAHPNEHRSDAAGSAAEVRSEGPARVLAIVVFILSALTLAVRKVPRRTGP